MTDDEAAKFYTDPQNLRPADQPGRHHQGKAQQLRSHVPVRLSSEMLERIQGAAREDGRTVSSWIRWVIQQELEQKPDAESRLERAARRLMKNVRPVQKGSWSAFASDGEIGGAIETVGWVIDSEEMNDLKEALEGLIYCSQCGSTLPCTEHPGP